MKQGHVRVLDVPSLEVVANLYFRENTRTRLIATPLGPGDSVSFFNADDTVRLEARRPVVDELAALAGRVLPFDDLVARVQTALSTSSDDEIRACDASELAESISTPT